MKAEVEVAVDRFRQPAGAGSGGMGVSSTGVRLHAQSNNSTATTFGMGESIGGVCTTDRSWWAFAIGARPKQPLAQNVSRRSGQLAARG